MTPRDAFWTVHSGTEREGPGEAADVAWAAQVLDLPRDARICDVGCGPGGDVTALLAAAPEGGVTAIDKHPPFVSATASRFADDPRVTAEQGQLVRREDGGLSDPADRGPFDLIWCAGAVYFEGIAAVLPRWRAALSASGAVVFSEPCLFQSSASDAARAFWGSGDTALSEVEILADVEAAGYRVVATRRLEDAGWHRYYTALEASCARLEPTDDPALASAIENARAEARDWEAVRAETGYLLIAARPA